MRSDLIAWNCGEWLAADSVNLGLDDLGLLQGAIIVERLRTVRGKPLDLAAHLDRLRNGCASLGICLPPVSNLAEIVERCAEVNAVALKVDLGSDFNIVILATPGKQAAVSPEPTLIVHPAPIDWSRLRHWYRHGQSLSIAETRNVPEPCWSPTIKTRARLQYYLADLAHTRYGLGADQTEHDFAGSVLLDLDDNLTETSAANLMIVEGTSLIAPLEGTVLEGISLRRSLRLAQTSGMDVRREPISLSRAAAADELLLCGTTGCLWPASRLAATAFPSVRGAAYQELKRHWVEDIGLDYSAQASRQAAK